MHDPYAPLRIPAVRYYLAGWMLMILGGQVRSLAIAVEVYERSGRNAAALGISGLMLALPILLFSLPGGALADRFDRLKITLLSTGITTLLSLGLAGLSYAQAPLWTLYATLFALGTSAALGLPARSAMLPNMVPRHLLASATTWNSSTFQAASIAGPIAGGALLSLTYPVCYLITTVLSAAFFVLLYRMESPGRKMAVARSAALADGKAVSPWRSLLEGLRFVYGTKVIFATILLDLLAVILGGVLYVLPVFQQEILGVSDFHLGLLRSAEAIGALVCGLVVAQFPPFRRAGRALLVAVAGFGVCIVGFGVSTNFYVSFALLLLAGACDNISVIVRHTLVGLMAPDEMRGRINAVNAVFIGSSNELGGFRAGTMARALGPVASVVIGGIGTLVSVAVVAVVFPAVRKLGSLAHPKEESKG